MSTEDNLALLATLDQKDASLRRRAGLMAWGAVAMAAAVMALLIVVSNRQVARAYRDLATVDNQHMKVSADLSGLNAQVRKLEEQKRVLLLELGPPKHQGQGQQGIRPGDNWSQAAPTQAWCYQEYQQLDVRFRYSAHCHRSQERCNEARTGALTATDCTHITDIPSGVWNPVSNGWMDSWFQYSDSELPLPFPPLEPDSP